VLFVNQSNKYKTWKTIIKQNRKEYIKIKEDINIGKIFVFFFKKIYLFGIHLYHYIII
jgi:hypothetical protein